MSLRMEPKIKSCRKCKRPNPPDAQECKWCGQKFGSITVPLPIVAVGCVVVVGILIVSHMATSNGETNGTGDTERPQRCRIVYTVTEKTDQRIAVRKIQTAIDTKKKRRRDEFYPADNSGGERKIYVITAKTCCGTTAGTGQVECKPNEMREIPAWQIVPVEVTPFYRETASSDIVQTQKDSAMVMGRNCAVFCFESKSAVGHRVISNQYYWKDILLKSERITETNDDHEIIMSVVAEAEEIQENIYIPDSVFALPR